MEMVFFGSSKFPELTKWKVGVLPLLHTDKFIKVEERGALYIDLRTAPKRVLCIGMAVYEWIGLPRCDGKCQKLELF